MAYETNDRFAQHFTDADKDAPPPYLGVRFDASGGFLPTPGNTVVCHVVPGSRTAAALLSVRAALKALPYGDRFAYTPPSSYHMTVFRGVIEGRREAGHWPADMPFETPIGETTRRYRERLAAFSAPPFCMRMVSVTPLGLVLTGATEADERTIRGIRDALVVPFGYREPDHDDYTFHVTLAYVKDWLPAGTEDAYLPALQSIAADFAAAVPVIELDAPALCSFDDMTEFKPVLRVGSAAEAA
jgi:hypothetical protein